MNNLAQLLGRLGVARVAAMGLVAVLLLGFFGFLMMRASTPVMAPLYSGLSFEDSSAIVSELQTQNIPFEIRGEGDTILVPRNQITTIRMTLAQDGLPQRGQVGYEIFDQQSTLGSTSFVQNINNVRALEGELARTISSLARIRSARVHLVLPERQLFQRDRKDPTASIVLAVRGELSAGEIRAIQHLVASAIEGLSPTRVSIVDDTGRLLASGAGNGTEGILANEMQERTLGVETRIRNSVEDLLANVVGAGKARVQVSAELDLQRFTRTAETFDPESQVVRSSQSRELANSSSGPGSNGAVTVANELPGAGAGNAADGGTLEQGQTTEEVVNYEISRTTETSVGEAGGIKRLSVAVVVDGTYTDDGAGNLVYVPRSDAELAQIGALVRTAAGFSEARGDQVEVVNLPFAERPELAALGTETAGLFNFTRDDLMNWAEMGVTLLIALALIFFVVRPLLRRVLAPESQPLALTRAAEVAPAETETAEDADSEQADRPAPQAPPWIEGAKFAGAQQVQTLKTVGALVDENPKQAATIVRDWLSNAA